MEFDGRILKILPQRSGKSQRTGNEWVAQPFVFEFFEHPTDRYSDKVVLETYDTNIIPLMQEGMACRCGFGHNVREWDGRTFNEIRLYKLELLNARPAADATGTVADENAAGGGAYGEGGTNGEETDEEGKKKDDLPF